MASAQKVNVVFEAVDKTKPAFDNLSKSLGGLRTAMFSIQGAIAGVVGSLAVKKIVDANRSFQSLEASLVTFTGSTEAAASQFAKLQQFAAKTPFALEEVVSGFNKLIGRGLEPTISSFEAFGNIASGTGKTLDQFVEAVADAAVGEFERLKEFGIKANVEGDKVRMTFGGVTKEIGKNSAEIQQYLEDLGNTKFAGAIERQANTLNGAFSNFGDAVDALAVAIGKSGINDFIVRSTRALTDLINRLKDATDANFGFAESIKFAIGGGDVSRLDGIRAEIKSIEKMIDAEEELTAGISSSMTFENERLRVLREQEKIILGINKINSRGQGFKDPRIIGPVGSIAQQQEMAKAVSQTTKSIDDYATRMRAAVSSAIQSSDIVLARELADQIKILDDLFFNAGLSADVYDSAMQKLTKSTEKAGEVQNNFADSIGWAAEIQQAVANAITDNDVTRAANLAKQIELLDKMFFDGAIDVNVYDAAMKQLVQTTEAFGNKTKEALRLVSDTRSEMEKTIGGGVQGFQAYIEEISNFSGFAEDATVRAFKGMEDAMIQFATTGKLSFGDLARSIINDIMRIYARQQILGMFSGIAGSGLFGGSLGTSLANMTSDPLGSFINLNNNFRANGGPVSGGSPYIVGERGPELFVPGSSGSIVPNNQLGGGVVVNQTINVTTGVQQTVRAEVMSLMPQIAGAAKAAVADAKLRGGSYAAAMR